MSKNKFIRKKEHTIKSAIINIILLLGLGYALLQQDLNIAGTTRLNNPTWDIYWDNVVVSDGSVSASTPEINSSETTVSYTVTLNEPGDFYEFSVDAVNA